MTPKQVTFDNTATSMVAKGLNTLCDAVKVTLGPGGRTVLIESPLNTAQSTKDGVTVAKNINFKNHHLNLGAEIAKEASSRTNDKAGDGPQPLYSKVLTPTGFVSMGDIEVGMDICGTNGSTQKVLEVYEKGERDIYKLNLTDGREVECCEDHLWTVITNRGKEITMSVRELRDGSGVIAQKKNGNRTHRYFIQRNAVEFPRQESDLPINPYLLGVLLGNGSLSGTGSIELSLGFRKRHILSKLEYPKGTEINVKDNEKYIRVKLKGESIRSALEELGLYGTKSTTKFIPDSYLYSNAQSRLQLLLGLIDTDEHVNSRGLFEFSTVSPNLAAGFSELCWGLGLDINIRLHTRKNDIDSYSERPIYRISQLKGRKYGIAIESIEPTGEKTRMRCIKVSNPDNLYITDEYVITHNTTTTCILLQDIYQRSNKLIQAGYKPEELRRGLLEAKSELIDTLKKSSKKIDSRDDLIRVASISANDDELGEIVGGMVYDMGSDALVSVGAHDKLGIEVERVEGLSISSGMAHRAFMTDSIRLESVMENAAVLVTDKRITLLNDIITLLNKLAEQDVNNLVIFSEAVEGAVMQVLLKNKLAGTYNTLAINAPETGERRREILQDIAAVTGAKFISDAMGTKLSDVNKEDLGHAERIVSNFDDTTVIGGDGNKEEIEKRTSYLESMVKKGKTDFERKPYRDRLAKLKGGVAVIRVGCATDTEKQEVFQRVEDSIHASKAALKEGIVAGGGFGLLQASNTLTGESVGLTVLKEACKSPLMQIAENVGESGDVVVGESLRRKEGFNAISKEYGDLMEMGVMDPVTVTINTIENSVSASIALITCGCVVTIEDDEDEGTEA